jgi:hypothetical protein
MQNFRTFFHTERQKKTNRLNKRRVPKNQVLQHFFQKLILLLKKVKF